MEKDYLIEKWLKNDLTLEEQQAFDKLDDVALNKAIVDHAQHFKASNFTKPESFEALEERLAKRKTPVRKLSWKRTLLQIASVIILGFAVYYGVFHNQLTTITTIAAEKTTITLPDASEVTLNAASKIVYDEANWSEQRSLRLKGEAFFKVAKGKKFDVVTSQGTVSVLGTQFNVQQRDTYFEITCYEGVVQVQTKTQVEKLLAGDSFRVVDGKSLNSSTDDIAPQWTNNFSTFKSTPFIRVLNEIERQYNISIVYNGEKKNELFTGGFVHDDLDNALKAITTPLSLTFNIEGTNKVIVLDK